MRPLILTVALLFPCQDGDGDKLIRQLGSDKVEDRESAGKALLARGNELHARIETALQDKDPEIASRAQQILTTVEGRIEWLAVRLERIRKENPTSYHRYLRSADAAIRLACHDQEWLDIAKSFDLQKFDLVDTRDRDGETRYRYLVKRKVLEFPGDFPFDLFVECTTRIRTSKTESSKSVLASTKAVLSGKLGLPLEDLRKRNPFPKETVLNRILDAEDVTKNCEDCPFLESIELEYCLIWDKNAETVPSGFSLDLEFVDRDRTKVRKTYFTTESGLDAPQSWDQKGDQHPVDDFVPRDTLSGFTYRGGNGWSRRKKDEPRTSWYLRRVESIAPPTTPPKKTWPVAYGLGDLKTLPKETVTLELAGDDLCEEDLDLVTRFPHLQSLEVHCSKIRGSPMAHISQARELKSLQFYGDSFSDEAATNLAGMPSLKTLDISSCRGLTDAGLKAIRGMKGLEHLNLEWVDSVAYEGILNLAKMEGLRRLHLWGRNNITDTDLETVSKIPQLRELSFGHSDRITASGLAHLSKLKLESLSVGYTTVNDAGLEQLSKIDTMDNLWLYGLNITNKGLESLRALVNLKSLYITDCEKITGEGIKLLMSALPGKFELE